MEAALSDDGKCYVGTTGKTSKPLTKHVGYFLFAVAKNLGQKGLLEFIRQDTLTDTREGSELVITCEIWRITPLGR